VAFAWIVLCALLTPNAAFAQAATPQPDTGPDLWSNLPGALVIGIPLAIFLALYISRRLGRTDDGDREPRRVGAVSRALARERDEGDDI
jgi:hypothetical protein